MFEVQYLCPIVISVYSEKKTDAVYITSTVLVYIAASIIIIVYALLDATLPCNSVHMHCNFICTVCVAVSLLLLSSTCKR